MIAATYINDFIPFCCHLVDRNETSDKEAVGTWKLYQR